MMAQESNALLLTEDTLPEGMKMIPLPGHSFEMTGFRAQDDIVYLADCLSSEETLNKYQISFIVDIAAYLQTLEKVKQMKAKLFIPSHAEITDDIAPLAQINIDRVNEICNQIAALCIEPICFEALLQKLFYIFNLSMTFEQHALVGSTVRSYLTYLSDQGFIYPEIRDNMRLWTRRVK